MFVFYTEFPQHLVPARMCKVGYASCYSYTYNYCDESRRIWLGVIVWDNKTSNMRYSKFTARSGASRSTRCMVTALTITAVASPPTSHLDEPPAESSKPAETSGNLFVVAHCAPLWGFAYSCSGEGARRRKMSSQNIDSRVLILQSLSKSVECLLSADCYERWHRSDRSHLTWDRTLPLRLNESWAI